MKSRRTKIIVTLGPATSTEQDILTIRDKGVDFVRINMSHSSIPDLKRYIGLAQDVGIPFILDTEGSQVRTGELETEVICFQENDEILIRSRAIVGDRREISLKPGSILEQLQPGDLIHIDFDTLILRVMDVSTVSQGFIKTRAITGGFIGRNKAVVLDLAMRRPVQLPPLSEKDLQSIELGLAMGVEHIACSFMRSGSAVDEVRRLTKNRMTIISKIECRDALQDIDQIIEKSDVLLIDRGDLSKEIPIERIPCTQKIIIDRARQRNKGVFVATNLLETMIEKRKPTRAEVHDVINTVVDGAAGLTLAAETAIGKFPMECINTLSKLIVHAEECMTEVRCAEGVHSVFIQSLAATNYLVDYETTAALISPHGGRLVSRVMEKMPDEASLRALPQVELDRDQQMEVEQLAFGTYSPLEGFMGQADLHSVLAYMRLANGAVWPLPILLDVPQNVADRLPVGGAISLTDQTGAPLALLHLSEKYPLDKEKLALALYGTQSSEHPGVKRVMGMNPMLLAGPIDLIAPRRSETRAYELTPAQVRRLFEERGWSTVLGFHTRNVIHRAHEHMQLEALESERCDGLLVQPIVGSRKPGDYHPRFVIKSYERMLDSVYPRNKVIFSVFATFSRYAGPREALFTALCRQNFGCSHFIVGRDHTGTGAYQNPNAAHEIFDQFPELPIKVVRYDEVYYSETLRRYVNGRGGSDSRDEGKRSISGTQARQMIERGLTPPDWFMRPQISSMLINAINEGEEVFVA
ncbi:MAG TPA: sulfate adenylyltransferase [Vicinamibacterales bacterium]|jgi:pyruvate kinase